MEKPEKLFCPACCGSGTDYKTNGDPDESRWDCPTCNGTGLASAVRDLAEEDPLAAALLFEAVEEGRGSIPCDCDDALGESCPDCHPLGDGKGGYYPDDHLWEGECNCESCTPPVPKPPKRDDFRCPEHGEPVTGHVAVPEGSYRRVCPECPPVANEAALVAECNAARDARVLALREERRVRHITRLRAKIRKGKPSS